MAFPQGANFRGTLAYVTDGANEDGVFGAGGSPSTPYPTTSAQGNTWGWESTDVVSSNANAALDRRLAGANYTTSGHDNPATFRIDLQSAGNYDIRLANARDDGYAHETATELFDTNSSLGVLTSGTLSAAGKVKDATNTEYTFAAWPGSNSAVTKTFSTTICRFTITAGAGSSVIAHANVAAAAGGGAINILIST